MPGFRECKRTALPLWRAAYIGKVKKTVDTDFFHLGCLSRGASQTSCDPSPFSPARKRLRLPLWRAAYIGKSEKMNGKLAIISGFSGAGKGTVIRKLMQEQGGYVLSVSMTTRSPRDNETDGVEYHFVSNEEFENLIRQNGFLEHAGYVDHYYGTPRAFVEENLQAGRDVLLEIEVQGAMQIREKFPDVIMVFVAPPDAVELERRLIKRGTDSPETVTKRLRQALTEVEQIREYTYLVINEKEDVCAGALNGIIRAGRIPTQGAIRSSEKKSVVKSSEKETVSADGAISGEFCSAHGIITDPEKKKAFAAGFKAGLEEILERRG